MGALELPRVGGGGLGMSRITPDYRVGMSNEGQKIGSPDGRAFVFIWSGLISVVGRGLITRCSNPNKLRKDLNRNSVVKDLSCWHCAKPLLLSEFYYNRKGVHANKKSRYYDLECAQLIGFIELVQSPKVAKLEEALA
jgi:hypothetical protein